MNDNCRFADTNVLIYALENNCTILYSEDLHHGQVIEERLSIMNPFHTEKEDNL